MDDFDIIVNDNYGDKSKDHPSMQAGSAETLSREDVIKMIQEGKKDKKQKTTEGLIILTLFIICALLFTWAAFDFGWDTVRLLAGVIVFSILVSFIKKVNDE